MRSQASPPIPIEHPGSEATQQRQASVSKKDGSRDNSRIRPRKEEQANAIAVIDRVYSGAPRPEYCREKRGSATIGAGISASLSAQDRTTVLQAEFER